jgi:pimeloyl-ACP methyl ester carboxylesterase
VVLCTPMTETVSAWRDKGELFEFRGHRIFTRSEGTGDTMLLVHGFPTASWDWASVWPELVARYRVLTLDMLGFGFSAKPRSFPYEITTQADLFEALLQRHGVTSYRLFAHDYGVSVALELLARQPQATARIERLCLLNGGLFPEAHHPALIQRLLASPVGPLIARLSSYRVFARSMRRIWGKTPPTDEDLRSMWQLVCESDGLSVMPGLIDYLRQRRQHRERWVNALVTASIPVRLINGLVDPIAGASIVARYRELVPKPDIVELADVGHYPQVEAPERVLAAAVEFFR